MTFFSAAQSMAPDTVASPLLDVNVQVPHKPVRVAFQCVFDGQCDIVGSVLARLDVDRIAHAAHTCQVTH
jgi:hypothetical protein